MPATPPWRVRRRFYVQYHDVDVLNHLNHAAYFPLMETLRCDYYLPLCGAPDPAGLDIIVAEATCRYLAPVRYGTELVGEVAPASPPGRTSFSLLYRFSLADAPGDVVARGRTVVVTYDYATNAKKPIPPAIRTALLADGVDPASEGW
ncbi:thioesterase superfamily protein [mine drainage metagenome]|uniref:Thioesterase superfamily protein n=1 Tax=mine drainage metagenome TaxID=410659 RepID=T1AQB0_9ZZZZ